MQLASNKPPSPRPPAERLDGVKPVALWMDQALSGEGRGADGGHAVPLQGLERSDVCIVGGGFVGLWTALHLLEENPGLDVVLLEADLCGAGASGRNGGLALSWWAKAAELERQCGYDDARWLCEEAQRAVEEIGRWSDQNQVASQFRKAGWIWAASSRAQLGAWEGALKDAERLGSDAFELLSPADIQQRSGSPQLIGGVLDRSSATVHPGFLVRGLRRIAAERGLRIHERSPVIAVESRPRLTVRTATGTVQTDRVVVATNAWILRMRRFHFLKRALAAISSDMVATRPIPAELEEMGRNGGEGITDSRLQVHYLRTTGDGRIAIGVGGGKLAYGGGVDGSFDYSRTRSARAAAGLAWLYPDLGSVELTHGWGGPVDRSTTGLPFFGRAPDDKRLIYGVGFSGNGVAPSYVAGRIMAGLAVDEDSRWTTNGLVGGPKGLFPPEPIRYLGGNLIRKAVQRKEASEDVGREAGRVVRRLAGMAPTGLVKVDD